MSPDDTAAPPAHRRAVWVILLVAALQSMMLAAIVADHGLTLARGETVVLKTEPIDPRDLFRGDYVRLSYAISRIEPGRIAGDDAFAVGDPIYVSLVAREEVWEPIAITHAKPAQDATGAATVGIRGRVTLVYEHAPVTRLPVSPKSSPQGDDAEPDPCPAPCTTLQVSYGIESYFVPEGEGLVLEDASNAERLAVVVAVRKTGRAAIKGLMLDGTIIAEEGLF